MEGEGGCDKVTAVSPSEPYFLGSSFVVFGRLGHRIVRSVAAMPPPHGGKKWGHTLLFFLPTLVSFSRSNPLLFRGTSVAGITAKSRTTDFSPSFLFWGENFCPSHSLGAAPGILRLFITGFLLLALWKALLQCVFGGGMFLDLRASTTTAG